jgi:hypothetical protein
MIKSIKPVVNKNKIPKVKGPGLDTALCSKYEDTSLSIDSIPNIPIRIYENENFVGIDLLLKNFF